MSLDKINFNKLSESINVLQKFLTIFKEAIAPLTDQGTVERNQPEEVPTGNGTTELLTAKEQPIPEPTPEPITEPISEPVDMAIVKAELVEREIEQPSSSAVASEASVNLTAPKRRIEEPESDISKRARIAEPALFVPPPLSSSPPPPPPPKPKNEFTIFNFKGESPLTHAAVVWNLRLLGIDEVILTDIQLIHGNEIRSVSTSMDVKFVRFRAIGQLEERLNGWVDRPGYVEEIHLENMRNYANPIQYSYLLNDVSKDGIAFFALYFFTAQEIMQNAPSWRPVDCRLAPKYVEFRYDQGSVRLTFADLLTPNWLPPARIAFTKFPKRMKQTLKYHSRQLGYEFNVLMGQCNRST